MKILVFQDKLSKFISRSSNLSRFAISSFLLLNLGLCQYKVTIEKKASLTGVFISLLKKTLCKNYYYL